MKRKSRTVLSLHCGNCDKLVIEGEINKSFKKYRQPLCEKCFKEHEKIIEWTYK